MDLEQYVSAYSGGTKVARLVFIGDRSEALRVDAYRLALKDLTEQTHDTKRMVLVADKLRDAQRKANLPLYSLDSEFVASLERTTSNKTDKLEVELKNYKNNLIKESIRMGYNDLGDHYYKRGDLDNALKSYVRTRDYCTSSKHITQMCLNVIKVSIELNNFGHVITYANKALATSDIKKEPIVAAKLTCAVALHHLSRSEFRMAALKFIETSFDIHNNFTDVISSQDIGTYGALCALASFNRNELKTNVLNNANFRLFLELCPEVRTLVTNFINSRYADCFKYIDNSKSDWMLDIYLHEHIDTLRNNIRKKALIQYFSPFTSVSLTRMAEAFHTNVGDLEAELATLILSKEILARIDSQNKILYARQVDQRGSTFQRALAVGHDYERHAKMALLRVNLVRANFVIRSDKKEDNPTAV